MPVGDAVAPPGPAAWVVHPTHLSASTHLPGQERERNREAVTSGLDEEARLARAAVSHAQQLKAGRRAEAQAQKEAANLSWKQKVRAWEQGCCGLASLSSGGEWHSCSSQTQPSRGGGYLGSRGSLLLTGSVMCVDDSPARTCKALNDKVCVESGTPHTSLAAGKEKTRARTASFLQKLH